MNAYKGCKYLIKTCSKSGIIVKYYYLVMPYWIFSIQSSVSHDSSDHHRSNMLIRCTNIFIMNVKTILCFFQDSLMNSNFKRETFKPIVTFLSLLTRLMHLCWISVNLKILLIPNFSIKVLASMQHFFKERNLYICWKCEIYLFFLINEKNVIYICKH